MPRFENCSVKPGWLTITCADNNSGVWLESVVSRLKPWPEAKLKVLEGDGIPKSKVGVVWIPGEDQPAPEKVLLRLKIQNKGLHTDKWKVLNSRLDNKGQTLTLSIDEASCTALSSLDNRPYLDFGRVTFRIKERRPSEATKSAEEDEPHSEQYSVRKSIPGPSQAPNVAPPPKPIAGPSRGSSLGSSREPMVGPSQQSTTGSSREPIAGLSREFIAWPSKEPTADLSSGPFLSSSRETLVGSFRPPLTHPSREPKAGPSRTGKPKIQTTLSGSGATGATTANTKPSTSDSY